jgi:hypothetical protein
MVPQGNRKTGGSERNQPYENRPKRRTLHAGVPPLLWIERHFTPKLERPIPHVIPLLRVQDQFRSRVHYKKLRNTFPAGSVREWRSAYVYAVLAICAPKAHFRQTGKFVLSFESFRTNPLFMRPEGDLAQANFSARIRGAFLPAIVRVAAGSGTARSIGSVMISDGQPLYFRVGRVAA